MTEQRSALRAALGRVGAWSFAPQTLPAARAQAGIRELEAMGIRATWLPESIASKEAFSQAAILLAGSRQMVLATGIANIYARDPMAMINGARTLSEAYPGRFVLGIGVSHAPSVATRGSVYGPPIKTMSDYLDAMEATTYAGPAPAHPVPLVLAALGPRMLDLAAERADGAHPYFVPVEHTAFARERLGRDPVLAVEMTAVLDTDGDRSLDVARAFAVRYLGMANYANNLRRMGWSEADLDGGGSARLIDALVARGDVGAIVGRVREHLDAGADHVCVQLRAADPTDLRLSGYRELMAALVEVG